MSEKTKIFRFGGAKPTAINLSRVEQVFVREKTITFKFATETSCVEMENQEHALNVYNKLVSYWEDS